MSQRLSPEQIIDFKKSIRNDNRVLFSRSFLIATFAYLGWFVFDYASSEYWVTFLKLRTAAVSCFVIPYFLLQNRALRNYSLEAFFIMVIAACLGIAGMFPYVNSGNFVAYAMGFTIPIYFSGIMPLWSPWWQLLVNIIGILSLGVATRQLNFELSDVQVMSAVFFTASAVTFASLASALRYNTTKQKFILFLKEKETALENESLAKELDELVRDQHKKIEEQTKELREKNDHLIHLNKVKDEFLASTSHELRTPLNAIVGFAGSLLGRLSGKAASDELQDLELIKNSGERLTGLVNDILDASKIEAKGVDLVKKPVNLLQIGTEVANVSRTLVDEGVKLNIEIPEDLTISADQNRLFQILQNLVGNAAKFTHEGQITIKASIVEDMAHIAIKDTGVGIPKDKFDTIFESFSQSDASISRKYGGTGLGLTIVKQLVEKHGGTVWVESTEDEGSTFTFTMPLSDSTVSFANEQPITVPTTPEAPANTATEDENKTEELAAAVIATHKLGGVDISVPVPTDENAPRILVVDDEPTNVRLIMSLLGNDGYHLSYALGGQETIDMFNESEEPICDLVLLDLRMPEVNGFQVCEYIRSRFDANTLPVVFLTADGDTGPVKDALITYSANGYYIKPVKTEMILPFIQSQLTISKLYREKEDSHQQKMESLNTTVYGIAHDVNTPLSTAASYTSMIRSSFRDFKEKVESGKLTQNSVKKYIEDQSDEQGHLAESLDRTQKLMDEFKSAVTGDFTAEKSTFALKAYVDEMVYEVEHAKPAGVQIQVEIEDSLEIDSYKELFYRILINFLMNSFNHAYDEDSTGVIKIQAQLKGTELHLDYFDDGKGVEEAILNRIFDPLFTTKGGAGGHGLGLANVHNIVSRLGGSVTWDSRLGEGAEFHVTLKLEPVA